MWNLDDEFYDEEDIVAKVHYIQELTTKNPYHGWRGETPNFIQRIEHAIDSIPPKYKKATLALFANTIYLPRSLLDEAWRESAHELIKHTGWSPTSGFHDALFIAVDNGGLVTDFSHIESISGREDNDVNPGYSTLSELIDAMHSWVGWKNKPEGIPILKKLNSVRTKRLWVILTDNAISGGSTKSDVEKLLQVRDILCCDGQLTPDTDPSIVICAQIITDQAVDEISALLHRERIFYGIRFDDRFRINLEACALFSSEDTLAEVRSLCEWFGNAYFLVNTDRRFEKRLREHRERGGQSNYAFGWRDCGYTIVTQQNCLSDSVPVLYYTPPSDLSATQVIPAPYSPPFPRTESRETHETSDDREKLKLLRTREYTDALRQALRQIEEADEGNNS